MTTRGRSPGCAQDHRVGGGPCRGHGLCSAPWLLRALRERPEGGRRRAQPGGFGLWEAAGFTWPTTSPAGSSRGKYFTPSEIPMSTRSRASKIPLQSKRIAAVQAPAIPIVADWIRATPGTISLGKGSSATDRRRKRSIASATSWPSRRATGIRQCTAFRRSWNCCRGSCGTTTACRLGADRC